MDKKSHNFTGLVLAATALLFGLSCADPVAVEKPAAPDMSSTIRAFESPDAPLNRGTLTEALEDFSAQLDILGALGVEELVIDLIALSLDADEASAEQGLRTTRQGLELSGEGFLRINRICPGHEGSDVPDAANGVMDFVVPFTDQGLDPVLWGNFTGCKYLSGEQSVVLSKGTGAKIGDIRLFVGESLQFGSFGQSDIIFELDVQFSLEGQPSQSSTIEFKLLLDGGLEIRLPVDEGDLVASLTGDVLGFRAGNGVWACRLGEKVCEETTSGDSFSF